MAKNVRLCWLALVVACSSLNSAWVCSAQETVPHTAERTVERTEDPCTISAEFRLELINPKFPGKALKTVLFAAAQPEVRALSNGELGIQVKVKEVGPFPGSLSFSFERTAAKSAKPRPAAKGPFAAKNMADVKAALTKEEDVLVDPPKGVKAGAPVIEDVIATVVWKPDGHPPCSITEKIRVIWDFAHPAAQVDWTLPTTPAGETGVAIGHTLGKERTKHTVPVQTFFSVKNAKKCCDKPGGYAVIQFVRHKVLIEESPRKVSTNNDWNLDILDSEAQRAASGQPYDPTFTHNPRDSNPNADPIVYPGPDGGGSSAIVQVDRPGIDEKLFDRLSRAGGSFTWQFHSFLVCEIKPAGAPAYLANGQVAQDISYEIVVTFPGNGAPATVTGNLLAKKAHSPCVLLKDLLAALDKKAPTGEGKLIDGYNSPKVHTVEIPR
jgi:hypothetical protein